jgi:outer membrane protein TolC
MFGSFPKLEYFNCRMKKTSSSLLGLLAMSALLSLSGCRASDLTNSVGHYEGLLTESDGTKTTQMIVTGDISSPVQLQLEMKVDAHGQNQTWTFGISANRRGQVSFIDKSSNITTPLASADDSCYVTANTPDGAKPGIRVCADGKEVKLDITPAAGTALSFVLDRAQTGSMPPLEPPTEYKLSQLTQRAIDRSFTSRIEFEQVVQARLQSENAHLNLLPHISIGTIIGWATSGVSAIGLIKSIGDFAPFLFPSNWFKAKEAGLQSVAERYTYLLMKADSGSITSGLVFQIARDKKSIERMQVERAAIAEIREQIYNRERLGLLPEGSTIDIDSILDAADKAVLGLQQAVAEEYTSLAQAAGFFNPNAVKGITLDTDASVEKPVTFDPALTSKDALDRAVELKQMDALIAVARAQRYQRYFDWLDPSGGSGASIGFGLGPYIAIGSSQVREAEIKRQQLQSTLLQKVANTITEIDTSIAAHELALKDVSIQQTRVQRYLNQIRIGVNVSTTDLINALASQMQADLDAVNTEFQYLVSYDKMQRTLYAGPYSNLGPGAATTRP